MDKLLCNKIDRQNYLLTQLNNNITFVMNPKGLGEERTGCAVMRSMKIEYELFMQLHEIENVTHL